LGYFANAQYDNNRHSECKEESQGIKHANFVINAGGATSQDILELIEVMRHRVLTKTNIDLKTEIVKLGEFDEITW